jgi:hypothetical protein
MVIPIACSRLLPNPDSYRDSIQFIFVNLGA